MKLRTVRSVFYLTLLIAVPAVAMQREKRAADLMEMELPEAAPIAAPLAPEAQLTKNQQLEAILAIQPLINAARQQMAQNIHAGAQALFAAKMQLDSIEPNVRDIKLISRFAQVKKNIVSDYGFLLKQLTQELETAIDRMNQADETDNEVEAARLRELAAQTSQSATDITARVIDDRNNDRRYMNGLQDQLAEAMAALADLYRRLV